MAPRHPAALPIAERSCPLIFTLPRRYDTAAPCALLCKHKRRDSVYWIVADRAPPTQRDVTAARYTKGRRPAALPTMGRSASVEPAPDEGPGRPDDAAPNDNKAASPEKADPPTPISTEQGQGSERAAPRTPQPRLGSAIHEAPSDGSRLEQLRRAETMRYDKDDDLTFMQRMWMTLDDPTFSRGAPRLSLVARLASTC